MTLLNKVKRYYIDEWGNLKTVYRKTHVWSWDTSRAACGSRVESIFGVQYYVLRHPTVTPTSLWWNINDGVHPTCERCYKTFFEQPNPLVDPIIRSAYKNEITLIP